MTASSRAWPHPVLLALALIVVLAFLALPPVAPLDKADQAAFAVCHRIPTHSFIFGGRPLPLCARCSGTYLGATAALAALVLTGKGRVARFPARRWWPLLTAFTLVWAVDGVNSFLTLIPGMPHLYEPSNILRLATGVLQGVVLAVILLPAFSLALWRKPVNVSPIETWKDAGLLLFAAAALAAPVSTQWVPLLYPLALLSGLAILLLLGAVNAMLALVLLRREGQAEHTRHLLGAFALGAALACAELLAIGAFRGFITERFGLPF